MKILSYITLIAAFAFGINNTNALDATTNDNTVAEMDGGHVNAAYDEASEAITLRMITDVSPDRVMVLLANHDGVVVFKEKVAVSTRGTILEIPMAGLTPGNYFLRVKGTTLNYSGRFKKK